MTFERNDNENTYGVLSTTIVDNGDGTVTADWADDYDFSNDKGGGGNYNLGLAIDPSNPAYVYTTGLRRERDLSDRPDRRGHGHGHRADERERRLPLRRPIARIRDQSAGPRGPDPHLRQRGLRTGRSDDSLDVARLAAHERQPERRRDVFGLGHGGPGRALYVAGGTQDAASFQGSLAPGTTTTWVSVNGGDGYGTSYDPSAGMIYATSDTLPGIQVAKASDNTIENVSFAGWDQIDTNASTGFPNLVAVSQADFGNPGQPRAVALSQYGLYEAQPTSLTSGTVTVVQINPAPNDNHTYSALSFGGTYLGQPDPYILYAARGDGTLWFDHTYAQRPPSSRAGRSRRDPQPGPGPGRLAPRLRPDRRRPLCQRGRRPDLVDVRGAAAVRPARNLLEPGGRADPDPGDDGEPARRRRPAWRRRPARRPGVGPDLLVLGRGQRPQHLGHGFRLRPRG